MTSRHRNAFRINGPLQGEPSHHRWIALIKARKTELDVNSHYPQEAAEQTLGVLVIWNAIVLVRRHCNDVDICHVQFDAINGIPWGYLTKTLICISTSHVKRHLIWKAVNVISFGGKKSINLNLAKPDIKEILQTDFATSTVLFVHASP